MYIYHYLHLMSAGLEYLHTDCHPRIIHRDVKSSNILLDEGMVAKVADFGLSKQAPEGVFSGVETLLRGTFGYFDPEYGIKSHSNPVFIADGCSCNCLAKSTLGVLY